MKDGPDLSGAAAPAVLDYARARFAALAAAERDALTAAAFARSLGVPWETIAGVTGRYTRQGLKKRLEAGGYTTGPEEGGNA